MAPLQLATAGNCHPHWARRGVVRVQSSCRDLRALDGCRRNLWAHDWHHGQGDVYVSLLLRLPPPLGSAVVLMLCAAEPTRRLEYSHSVFQTRRASPQERMLFLALRQPSGMCMRASWAGLAEEPQTQCSGVMRITVTVVVIMFELTGALTYILPTMVCLSRAPAARHNYNKIYL